MVWMHMVLVTTSSNLHGESLLWHNSGNKFEFSIYVCAYFNLFLIPWSLLSLFSSTNIKNSYKLDRLENQEHPPKLSLRATLVIASK